MLLMASNFCQKAEVVYTFNLSEGSCNSLIVVDISNFILEVVEGLVT